MQFKIKRQQSRRESRKGQEGKSYLQKSEYLTTIYLTVASWKRSVFSLSYILLEHRSVVVQAQEIEIGDLLCDLLENAVIFWYKCSCR